MYFFPIWGGTPSTPSICFSFSASIKHFTIAVFSFLQYFKWTSCRVKINSWVNVSGARSDPETQAPPQHLQYPEVVTWDIKTTTSCQEQPPDWLYRSNQIQEKAVSFARCPLWGRCGRCLSSREKRSRSAFPCRCEDRKKHRHADVNHRPAAALPCSRALSGSAVSMNL